MALAYLRLARPVTLLPVLLIAVIFGLLPTGGHVSADQFLLLVLAGAILTVGNFGSNVLDQLGGQAEDSVHPTKQDRPIVNGDIDPMQALSVAVGAWVVAAIAAAVFLPRAFLVVDLVILLFALGYVFPPAMKRRTFPAGLVWIAIPRGGLGIVAAWCVFGSAADPRLWAILVVTIPFVFYANSAKDIDDAAADAEAGNQTPATLFGERFCRAFALVGFLWVPVAVLITGLYRWDPLLLLTPLLTAVGILGALRWPGEKYWRVGFYGGFLLLALLFAAVLL